MLFAGGFGGQMEGPALIPTKLNAGFLLDIVEIPLIPGPSVFTSYTCDAFLISISKLE